MAKTVWFATKLTMKEAQVLNMEEAQIVSQLDSECKAC